MLDPQTWSSETIHVPMTYIHTLEHEEHTATAIRSNGPLMHITMRIDF